jgi:hypothetical protein
MCESTIWPGLRELTTFAKLVTCSMVILEKRGTSMVMRSRTVCRGSSSNNSSRNRGKRWMCVLQRRGASAW